MSAAGWRSFRILNTRFDNSSRTDDCAFFNLKTYEQEQIIIFFLFSSVFIFFLFLTVLYYDTERRQDLNTPPSFY